MANETKPKRIRNTEAGSKAKLEKLALYCRISIEIMEALPDSTDTTKGQVIALKGVLRQIEGA